MDKFKDAKVTKNRLSNTVSRKLEDMILNGTLMIGEKLPSENELSELFGVSRNILREALVSLRERGLIEVKTGLGAFVVEPEGTITDVVSRLIKFNDISKENIYEVRVSLEVSSIGCAALRAEDKEIQQLKKITYKMKKINNFEEWLRLETLFHTNIAKLSKNKLYYVLIRDLYKLLYEFFVDIYPIKKQKDTFKNHIGIVEAIESGERLIAEKTMLDHLYYSKELVAKKWV